MHQQAGNQLTEQCRDKTGLGSSDLYQLLTKCSHYTRTTTISHDVSAHKKKLRKKKNESLFPFSWNEHSGRAKTFGKSDMNKVEELREHICDLQQQFASVRDTSHARLKQIERCV
jgi:hypothetical protein